MESGRIICSNSCPTPQVPSSLFLSRTCNAPALTVGNVARAVFCVFVSSIRPRYATRLLSRCSHPTWASTLSATHPITHVQSPPCLPRSGSFQVGVNCRGLLGPVPVEERGRKPIGQRERWAVAHGSSGVRIPLHGGPEWVPSSQAFLPLMQLVIIAGGLSLGKGQGGQGSFCSWATLKGPTAAGHLPAATPAAGVGGPGHAHSTSTLYQGTVGPTPLSPTTTAVALDRIVPEGQGRGEEPIAFKPSYNSIVGTLDQLFLIVENF